MCGRFNLTAPGDLLAEEFDLDEAPLLKPRFNIAPSQPIAAIRLQGERGRRGLGELRWGLILETRDAPRAAEPQGELFPGLTSAPVRERRQINARSETAARSPAFRESFAQRRCLIPATGFYEWQRAPDSRPQPWLFQRADGRPFAFAGLWQPDQEATGSGNCLILTTAPNELARAVHDRMPAILVPGDYAAWLDPATARPRLQALLRPFRGEEMVAFPVGSAVNSPANDDPSCLEPLPSDRT